MFRRRAPLHMFFALGFVVGGAAAAQGVVGEFLAGKLVAPKVGQWAWYDVKDTATGLEFEVRQAIVGEEKVGREKGYWIEIELVPAVGYRRIFKALLTGPADKAKNIHAVIVKEGPEPAYEAPRESLNDDTKELKRTKRTSLGLENVSTPSGLVRAEHFSVTEGDRSLDIWVNEQIPPTGVVSLKSPGGEMTLRNYGIGGEFGETRITEKPIPLKAEPQPAPPAETPQGAPPGTPKEE